MLRRYNAYLIFGDKVALVDASHEKFHDLFLDTLEAQLKAAGAVGCCGEVGQLEHTHSTPFLDKAQGRRSGGVL